MPKVRVVELPKFQKAGKAKPKVTHYIFAEDYSKPPFNLPNDAKNNPFITEAANLKEYITKNYPGEEVVVIPGYGQEYFKNQVLPNLNKAGKNDRVYIMGHHGDRYAGVDNELWGDALEQAQLKSGNFNCYLGSCFSQDLAGTAGDEEGFGNSPAFSRVNNFYYRPATKWLGVNPNANVYPGHSEWGVLDAMYSRSDYNPNFDRYRQEANAYYDKLENEYIFDNKEYKNIRALMSKASEKLRGSNIYNQKYIAEYDKLNDKGFVPEETVVVNGDVIIGKVTPIQPAPGSNKCYKDASEIYKSGEPAIIDKVFFLNQIREDDKQSRI